jgi:hypothetical protein
MYLPRTMAIWEGRINGILYRENNKAGNVGLEYGEELETREDTI